MNVRRYRIKTNFQHVGRMSEYEKSVWKETQLSKVVKEAANSISKQICKSLGYETPHREIEGLVYPRMPLEHLDLSGSGIDDAGLRFLCGMPLKKLILSGCYAITDAGLKFLRGMPLKHLDLSGCQLITDDGLVYLRDMPLSTLILSGCREITNAGLEHLRRMPLNYIDLSYLDRIAFNELGPLKNMHLTCLVAWFDVPRRFYENAYANLQEGINKLRREADFRVVARCCLMCKRHMMEYKRSIMESEYCKKCDPWCDAVRKLDRKLDRGPDYREDFPLFIRTRVRPLECKLVNDFLYSVTNIPADVCAIIVGYAVP